jgi:hypothetical protein
VAFVVLVLGTATPAALGFVAIFAAVTFVAGAFTAFLAPALVVALVVALVAAFAVTFAPLAFVVAFAAVILVARVFVAATLVGAGFFARTLFSAAEVAFFTAMLLGPFKMAGVVPTRREYVCA